MTDLRATSASLVLPAEMSGRLFVRDTNGQLIAEVHKLPAQPIELGLPPGRYRVTLDDNRRLSEAMVDLGAGRSNVLGPSAFVAMVPVTASARGPGSGQPDAATGLWLRQDPQSFPTVLVNLSIYPGFDTAGGRLTNNAFVAGFFARSANLRGTSLTLGHYTLQDVLGTEISAIGSANGGDMRGLRLSGIGSLTRGDISGLEVSGIGNVGFGGMDGLQLAGTINWVAGRLTGWQVAGLFNAAAGGRGIQLAGGANAVKNGFEGLQLAGGANVALHGARSRGLQIAGGFNVVDALEGAQISVVNVGGDVLGTQVGVVNVARKVRGAQIGVVNLADDMNGVSLGLVTLVRNGIHDLDLSTSEVGGPVLSGLLGSRRFYTRLGIGLLAGPSDIPGGRSVATGSAADRQHFMLVWGFGARFNLQDRWSLDAEAVATQFHRTSDWVPADAVGASARLLVGIRLASSLRIVFGPTYNVVVGWNGTDLVTGSGFAESVSTQGQSTIRTYPGIVLGLRV
jgi:hypothetical protein